MIKLLILVVVAAVFLFACTKKKQIAELIEAIPSASKKKTADNFTQYTIRAGQHYCDQNILKTVSGTEMAFTARFDSSAVYELPKTNYDHNADANKLYGFAEGADDHMNSARIGWRWFQGELQLMAYVYVKGMLQRDVVSYDPPVITAVPLNSDVQCSIKVTPSGYLFTVNGVQRSMPRGRTTSAYSGIQLYPYFGGDYAAPHDINILIK